MRKNRLFKILESKSFNKLYKNGSIKLPFLTEIGKFSIKKFQQWLQLIIRKEIDVSLISPGECGKYRKSWGLSAAIFVIHL